MILARDLAADRIAGACKPLPPNSWACVAEILASDCQHGLNFRRPNSNRVWAWVFWSWCASGEGPVAIFITYERIAIKYIRILLDPQWQRHFPSGAAPWGLFNKILINLMSTFGS